VSLLSIMAEALVSDEVVPLTTADIIEMTVDELRYELRQHGGLISGRNKSQLQTVLIQAISEAAASMSAIPSQPAETVMPTTQHSALSELEQQSLMEDSDRVPVQGGVVTEQPAAQPVPPSTQDRALELGALPKVPTEVRRVSGVTRRSGTPAAGMTMEPAKVQLELRRLELEERRLELQAEERARQHELELRRLEIEAGRPKPDSTRAQSPTFRVADAVKLIPRFNEHDIESFLISFEKIAELNALPKDKYAAVLQAHLTGKALKVFTELSVQECQNYSVLKAALLTAYSVVPEVYRQRFRGITMS